MWVNPQRLTELLVKHVGQPFFDASLLPTALVSDLASRHVKVALSGDGGDELFSGYQRYQARILMRWYTRLPKVLRKLAGTAVRSLPEPMAHHSRSILKKAHLFLDAVNRYEDETPYTVPMLYTASDFSILAPELADKGHTPPALPEQCELDDIVQMMCADAMIYLPQDILLKVDRASMAHSLETRVPFLDNDLVDFAMQIPVSLKLGQIEEVMRINENEPGKLKKYFEKTKDGKLILRKVMERYIPKEITGAVKQGFSAPDASWFKGDSIDYVKSKLYKSNAYIYD